MENGNGSIGASDAATLALLYGGNRGGGIGVGAGGYDGYGNVGNAVRLDRNAQQVEDQADATRNFIAAGAAGISGAFENAERSRQFTAIRDGQFQSELRTNDRLLALQAEMNVNAKAAAACCCELKLENCKNTSTILAAVNAGDQKILDKINDNEISRLKDELAQARSHHGH